MQKSGAKSNCQTELPGAAAKSNCEEQLPCGVVGRKGVKATWAKISDKEGFVMVLVVVVFVVVVMFVVVAVGKKVSIYSRWVVLSTSLYVLLFPSD